MGTATVENHRQHLTSSPAPSTWKGPSAQLGLKEAGEDTAFTGRQRSRLSRGGAAGGTGLEHGPHAAGDSRGYGLGTH